MKKILWASPNTLLDSANGAALSIREILTQLSKNDFEIKILGATIVVNPNGMSFLNQFSQVFKENLHKFIKIKDDNLEHQLLITETIFRRKMLSFEEKIWFDEYCRILDEFKPDFVFFFDNSLITYLTASEAKHRGIPTVVYLAHPNNTGERWQRDVDLILTDSDATAKFYKKKENYNLIPIGKFIPIEKYKAENPTKENILFINPSLEKGVVIVIQLALYLENIRPDIKFEIVESRSDFINILKNISTKMGKKRDSLSNIILTPNNNDMKPIYSRAKIVLVPSLWWESSSRVIVEAMINSIPIIATNRGGISETLGKCGFLINLNSKYYEKPYDKFLQENEIAEVANIIIKLYDDKKFYEEISGITLKEYDKRHNINLKTKNLIKILENSIKKTTSNTFINLDETPYVSIVTVCTNRLEHLKISLPEMCKQSFSEVIVVDYNCKEGTSDFVTTTYPEVKVVKIKNNDPFNISKARNIGAEEAKGKFILFIDADKILQGDLALWIKNNSMETNFYVASPSLILNKIGTVVISKSDFFKFGLYDEAFDSWGGEDSDLYHRLVYQNIKKQFFPTDFIKDIKHGDDIRFLNNYTKSQSFSINIMYRQIKYDLEYLNNKQLDLESRKNIISGIRKNLLKQPNTNNNFSVSIDYSMKFLNTLLKRTIIYETNKINNFIEESKNEFN